MRNPRAQTQPDASAHDVLTSLYERHAGALRTIALRLTGRDPYWADDVVQETFVRAWQHAGRLRLGEGSLLPWLSTVARRVVIDDVRRRDRRPQEVSEEPLRYVAGRDAFEPLVDRLVVADALRRVSPAHRAVLVAMYYLGLTVRQTADLFGIPVGTAKTRLHYGLRALRAALRESEIIA